MKESDRCTTPSLDACMRGIHAGRLFKCQGAYYGSTLTRTLRHPQGSLLPKGRKLGTKKPGLRRSVTPVLVRRGDPVDHTLILVDANSATIRAGVGAMQGRIARRCSSVVGATSHRVTFCVSLNSVLPRVTYRQTVVVTEVDGVVIRAVGGDGVAVDLTGARHAYATAVGAGVGAMNFGGLCSWSASVIETALGRVTSGITGLSFVP